MHPLSIRARFDEILNTDYDTAGRGARMQGRIFGYKTDLVVQIIIYAAILVIGIFIVVGWLAFVK